jgi:ribonuclease G
MNLEKIVTDESSVYEALRQTFLKEDIVQKDRLELYQDPALSLSALYGLRSKLEEALRERVWLRSGAYLVISPTEALTVIDVNSGKCIKGKDTDFYLKVNEEAAAEIARQLRLRNISGICIVDFINMDTEDARTRLIHTLKHHLAKDMVPSVFIDFTKLGLAEITRKKIKKPLWEQVAETVF